MDKDAQEKKFAKVMREFEDGKLRSSDGKVVKDRGIAKAIAASESGMMPKRKEKPEHDTEHEHDDGERCPYCDQAMPDKGDDSEDDGE